MQINKVSQLLQPNVNDIKSNNTNSNNSFELMLQEMIENIKNEDMINNTASINNVNNMALTNNINSSDKINLESKTVNGLDSLSLNPQKLAQMLDIMQMSAKASATTNFGNDDDENSDTELQDSLNPLSSTDSNNGISDLLQKVLNNSTNNSSKFLDTTS
ncbi:hypothetical protein SAMN02745163_02307 [Clostridium cavendishii DSM 21758]|uniref:Uncharacterized protein n=1 Tax=Clostridium cavendishii DSM 21758 TaxID=1121302 RepID=A0A1M6KVG6_9CLOT|nr:hypothetical protein [Clostridium cavendishii]SHJ62862.1 hypothetical protein SAMN02745163_02307 [Clostridium cavendishii DSM 21758]